MWFNGYLEILLARDRAEQMCRDAERDRLVRSMRGPVGSPNVRRRGRARVV
jgi:hypothetical protein